MALTPLRWVAGLIIGCLAAAVIVLRSPPQRPTARDRVQDRLERQANRSSRPASVAAGRLRLAQLMDSTRVVIARSRNIAPVRVFTDAAFPAATRAGLDSLASLAVGQLRDSGRTGIDVVFTYDTLSVLRRQPVGIWGTVTDYILPTRAGDRCTVMTRVGIDPQTRQPYAHFRAAVEARQQLLGPCAFYRAFGMPGPQVDRWLRERGWAFAGDGSWNQPSPSVEMQADRYAGMINGYQRLEMSVDGIGCAAAKLDACERAATIRGRGRSAPTIWNDNILYRPYLPLGRSRGRFNPRDLGRNEEFLLSDMVRTVGRDKFGRFWTSDQPVPVAYEKATGEPLGAWVSRWVVGQYGKVEQPGMSPTGVGAGLLVILAGMIAALAVSSRRQFA